MSIYNDGALHIINVPLLTVIVVGNGIMVYHDYESDRHLWLSFPRWLSERICVQCGGIIRFERWWLRNGHPLHEHCARMFSKDEQKKMSYEQG